MKTTEQKAKKYDEALKNPSFASYESSLIAKGKHRQREDLLSFINSLQQEQSEVDLEKELQLFLCNYDYEFDDDAPACDIARHFYELGLNARKGEQEVDLEEFTEKMNAWKARFNRPDDIPIKATMAFTARMFYQYPNIARQWYEQDTKDYTENWMDSKIKRNNI